MFAAWQEVDFTLAEVRRFLQDGVLPADEKAACKLLLDRTHYVLIEDVLYRVMKDSMLRLHHRRKIDALCSKPMQVYLEVICMTTRRNRKISNSLHLPSDISLSVIT